MEPRYYETAAGRCPARDFLSSVEAKFEAQIRTDIVLFAREGEKAPVSRRPVKGFSPLWELRTGGYRTIVWREGNVLWIFEICKKQDERRGYERAMARYKETRR